MPVNSSERIKIYWWLMVILLSYILPTTVSGKNFESMILFFSGIKRIIVYLNFFIISKISG